MISLEGLQFYGKHGLHEQERVLGNTFIIDVTLGLDFWKAAKHDSIHHTIDYEQVYAIIKQENNQSCKLLEHLGYRIIIQLFKVFSQMECVAIDIRKQTPPISGICQSAKVSIRLTKSEFLSRQEIEKT